MSEFDALVPLPGTNLDGIEGSHIPGGCHAARYGGGDEYQAVEPSLSLATLLQPINSDLWAECTASLERLRVSSLQWPHGYSEAGIRLLPDDAAPPAASLTWGTVQLLVTRAPRSDGSAAQHLSLMLHGWLFRDFGASGRKAHQKFPLLAVFRPHNLSPPESRAGPEWLRIDGSYGWADQHVHCDEPVDLGGFAFAEAFVGADMARVKVREPRQVATFWLAAIDTEASAGLLTLCIILPEAFPAQAEEQMRRERMTERISQLLRTHLPDSEATEAACAALSQGLRMGLPTVGS
jgi:hypothetical protein